MTEKNRTTLDNFYLVLEDGTKLPAETNEIEIKAEGEAPQFNPPSEYHGSFDFEVPKCFKNLDKYIENINFNLVRGWNETIKRRTGSL